MAMLEDLLNRKPGDPVPSQVPGAPPLPSSPGGLNPPAMSATPVGRPPLPPQPTFGGQPGAKLPLSGAQPQAKPVGPSPTPKPAAQAQPAQAPAPAPSLAPTYQMGTPPSRGSLATLKQLHPGGFTVALPYGTMNPDGTITVNPGGEPAYQAAVLKRKQEFGPHPWANDPNAPPPPAELGKPAINPFTGQWS